MPARGPEFGLPAEAAEAARETAPVGGPPPAAAPGSPRSPTDAAAPGPRLPGNSPRGNSAGDLSGSDGPDDLDEVVESMAARMDASNAAAAPPSTFATPNDADQDFAKNIFAPIVLR